MGYVVASLVGGVFFGGLGGGVAFPTLPTLGPLVALPLVARVGFAAEYLACAVLALGAGVLVARTLLGDATPTDAVPADD
ncbi:MAG: hypothetical protein ABEJ61_08845 [Haloferacaceae archaeon]